MVTLPSLPAIVRGRVRHARVHPIRHRLAFGTHLWLVDLARRLPDGPLASFPVDDHFRGAPSLEQGARDFAAEHGAETLEGDRVLMLASARTLGYVFNPLSVFWCITPGGDVRWAILEIHNTYGARHAHLVIPDAQGRVRFAKEFYVSPFFTVDGAYRVHLQLEAERVGVAVSLDQAGRNVFSATFEGRPVAANTAQVLLAAARTPLASYQTALRIRVHGIWLWLRRLPVVPRSDTPTPAGAR